MREVRVTEVGEHDLLWQANSLAFPVRPYRRESGVRAEVLVLREATPRKFKGDHLVPVRDLLASTNIQFPQPATEEIGRFIDAATRSKGHTIRR